MRRMLLVPAAALFGVLLVAGPAWAHSEFDPDQAGTGNVVALQLSVENEQSDVGTTQVQLFFPEGVPITLVDLPAVAGWTTAVEGGAIGAPVTSVTWSRPTATPDENPLLPLTIGPMPADPVRLQFKALQTYSNGDIERWIEDWPAGAPEPDHPAPVLEVVTGGPGTAPGTTAAAPTTTVEAPTTTTTEATTESTLIAPTPDESDDDSSSNVGLIVGVIAAVVIIAAIVGFVLWRRSQRSGTPPTTPTTPTTDAPEPPGGPEADA
jgi:periplasmic copper chaperone A